MARNEVGLRNEDLRAAITPALHGDYERLEDLLSRHGITPSGKPNLGLAAAFGAELATSKVQATRLLLRLASDDSAPNTPRVFLPVAAAHGFTHCIREGRDVQAGWAALAELAADERTPVRIGALDALVTLGAREGMADMFVARADEWLEIDDREIRFGAAGLALEVLSDPKVLAGVGDADALLSYVSRVMQDVADAPRAAERSDARRRALTSLSQAIGRFVTSVRAGDKGVSWLELECGRTKHPDVRRALSDAITKLSAAPHAPRAVVIDGLRASLEASAKPLREIARVRPGTGRGKRSRRTR